MGCAAEVMLVLTTDEFPSETSWDITDAALTVFAGVSSYTGWPNATFVELAYLYDGTYTFGIHDTYGDGLCPVSATAGSYELWVDGVFQASGGGFTYDEYVTFDVTGCSGPVGDDDDFGDDDDDDDSAVGDDDDLTDDDDDLTDDDDDFADDDDSAADDDDSAPVDPLMTTYCLDWSTAVFSDPPNLESTLSALGSAMTDFPLLFSPTLVDPVGAEIDGVGQHAITGTCDPDWSTSALTVNPNGPGGYNAPHMMLGPVEFVMGLEVEESY